MGAGADEAQFVSCDAVDQKPVRLYAGFPMRRRPTLKGLLKNPPKGKMPAAHSPPWQVIPPSSVCKQILAPHSV